MDQLLWPLPSDGDGTLDFIDCQGFAGGFSAGAATAGGYRLVAKRENVKGFGVPLLEANRAFLGDAWQAQCTAPDEWEPVDADVVLGTPPCSAFSGMTSGYAMHGMGSHVNECMWDLFRYAARVRPRAVLLESVGQAYTRGLPLMRALVSDLNERTGLGYRTVHVLQNNLSCGGATIRRRYFLVAVRGPFGVEVPTPHRLATVGDAIADLRPLDLTFERQAHVAAPTWWSARQRTAADDVDGHQVPDMRHGRRLADLTARTPWRPGETESDIIRRYYEEHGELPESWRYPSTDGLTRDKCLLNRNFQVGGFGQARFWPWDRPGTVISGKGSLQTWHPDQRHFTHREVARLMGFPDAWRVGAAAAHPQLFQYWGKGTSVHPAAWVLAWLRESLASRPGPERGTPVDADHDDVLIDVSQAWKGAENAEFGRPARRGAREDASAAYASAPHDAVA